MPRRDDPEPFALKLGMRINALRLERKMSLKQLSEETGVSKGQLSSVEHGLVMVKLATAVKIAEGLDMTVVVLLSFPGESSVETIIEQVRGMSPRQLAKLTRLISKLRTSASDGA
jgi:transcriptional regulator with XRE-family HTH domain